MPKTRLFSMVFLFVFAGTIRSAGQTGSAGWKGSVETKDGVKIVSNPAQPPNGRIALELEQDLVLGDGVDENSMFFYRFDTAVDRAGRFYVLDYRSYRVQKFDRSGAFLQTIGKQGQGPAEFQNPTSIWCDDKGQLQVIDDGKVHLFDASGTYLKSFPTAMSARQAVVFPDGNVLRMNLAFGREKVLEEIVLTDGSGKILQTPASHFSQKIDAAFNQKKNFTIDFPEILLAPWTEGRALFGFPSEYALKAADGRGRIVMIIRKDGQPEEYSAPDKDRAYRSIIAQYSNYKDKRAELERDTAFPKFRPFFEAIQTDAEGWIYVRRLIPGAEKDGRREYDIFDRDGRFLSTVTFTGDESLFDRGYLYTRKSNPQKECVQLTRWKIKNWDRIIGLPGK